MVVCYSCPGVSVVARGWFKNLRVLIEYAAFHLWASIRVLCSLGRMGQKPKQESYKLNVPHFGRFRRSCLHS